MFKHFLITRFNIKKSDWSHTHRGVEVLTESWMEQRFKLFEQYCLPSVRNQSNQHFSWLVFFDINTPVLFRDKIQELQKNYPNFKPVFIDDYDKLYPELLKQIKGVVTENDEYIITSRLDNDDSLNAAFIKTIQGSTFNGNRYIVDVINGYQLILESNEGVYFKKCAYQLNPFISLIEPTSNFVTVLAKKHNAWAGCADVHEIYDKRLWLQVIHNRNYLNREARQSKILTDIPVDEFGLQLSEKTIMSSSRARWLNIQLTVEKRLNVAKGKLAGLTLFKKEK